MFVPKNDFNPDKEINTIVSLNSLKQLIIFLEIGI